MSRDEGMLGRWSRRKRAAEAEEDAKPKAPLAERDETPPDPQPAPLSDDAWLDQQGLPDPDTLGQGDDFQAFLKKGVPDLLRRRALRRLWLSNPAFANLDGLLDYGDDFTDAAMVPDVLNTAYKIGRGLLSDPVEAPAEDPAPQDADDPEKANGINRDTEPALAEAPPDPEPPAAIAQADIKKPTDYTENEEENDPRPRRMAFRHD